jgi:hypothetical protein
LNQFFGRRTHGGVGDGINFLHQPADPLHAFAKSFIVRHNPPRYKKGSESAVQNAKQVDGKPIWQFH